MLVMPVHNDQPINAAQIEALGIGMKVKAFPTTATMLYQNAIEVLKNDAIRENMSMLSRRVTARGGIKEAADRIEWMMLGS